jgi:hypothetical protein
LSGRFPPAILRVLQALADLLPQIVQHNTTTALMRLYRPTANFCAVAGTLESKIVAAMQ